MDLNETIIEKASMDYEEFQQGVKKKNYHLLNFIKQEFLCRGYNGTKQKIVLNAKASRALIGAGIITEQGIYKFSISPIDRDTFIITFKVNTQLMSNGQIRYYNETYNLNIPLNEDVEVLDDIDRLDLPTKGNIHLIKGDADEIVSSY